MSSRPGEATDPETTGTEATIANIPACVPPPRDPWWQPVQRVAHNWNSVRHTEQTHVVAMLPSYLPEYLRSLGENWYAAFTYRHKPPSNPSQGIPQQQRFDTQIRLRCKQDRYFPVILHYQVCFVDHNNASSGWHGEWELITTQGNRALAMSGRSLQHGTTLWDAMGTIWDAMGSQGNRAQLRQFLCLRFRYNAAEPYWHIAEYAEGHTAALDNRRLHVAFWYGTKFEGWPREEQDRHEFWILEPPIFHCDPPRALAAPPLHYSQDEWDVL